MTKGESHDPGLGGNYAHVESNDTRKGDGLRRKSFSLGTLTGHGGAVRRWFENVSVVGGIDDLARVLLSAGQDIANPFISQDLI